MFAQHERGAQPPTPEERVAALLAAADAPTGHGPMPGEPAALAAFRAANPTTSPRPSRRSRMLSPPTPFKTAAAAALGAGVLVTGSVAAAATGSLPGAAQDTASNMLAHVGVTVPGADEHSAGHADEPGSTSQTTDGAGDASGSEAGDAGKGDEVSKMATTTDLTGVDKGAAISTLASGGKSQAGADHAETPDQAGTAGESDGHAQVDTPNSGGTDHPDTTGGDAGQQQAGGSGTADDASGDDADGAVASGTTADTASDGHSSAGSQNAAGDRP